MHYLKEEAPGKNLKRINKVLKSALCLIVNRSSKRQWQLLRGSKVLSQAPTLKDFLPLFQDIITTLLKKRDIEIMNIFYRHGVTHSIKE